MRMNPDVARLLQSQHGVIAASQLVELGLSRGVIMRLSRDWIRVARGVFIAGTVTWEAMARAALLIAGDDAALGSRAALHLWGLSEDPPKEIVVWTRRDVASFSHGSWRVRFRRASRRGRGAIARTSVEESLLDLADEAGEQEFVAMLTRAFADGVTTGPRMIAAQEVRGRVGHRALLLELCNLSGVESVLEYLFHHNVLLAHGLPEPQRQERTEAGRVDGRYAGAGVVVELDGTTYHRDKGHDYHRDNEHVIQRDDRTLRFGWAQCTTSACESARQVAAALRRGGWNGRRAAAKCRCLDA